MPLTRVLRLLLISFVAACTFGCGNSSDNNFDLNQSFQNTDAPVRLAFLNVPQRAAGTTFVPIRVGILDHNGQIVPTANNAVTISLANPGGATLSGTTTVNAVNGVAVFSDLSVDTPGDYNFTATADGLLSAQSQEFDITAGAPATITFLQGPPPLPTTNPPAPGTFVVKGQAISPTISVEVRDAFGNLVTNDSTVTIVIANDPTGTATLGGTTQVPVSNGVATFDDLTVETGGGVLVLAAVSGQGLAVSDPFLVAADLKGYFVSLPNPTTTPPTPPVFLRVDLFPTPNLTPDPVGSNMGALIGVDLVTGLTFHPNGNMYAAAITGGMSPVLTLLTLDPEAADSDSPILAQTPITGTNGFTVSGMTVNPADGTVYIYMADGTNVGVHSLNINTGAATFVGAPGLAGVGQGLAWQPFVASPFMFTKGGDTANGLSTIDPATGAATEIPGTDGNLTATVLDLLVNPFNTELLAIRRTGTPGLSEEIVVVNTTDGSQTVFAPSSAAAGLATGTTYIQEPVVP